LLAGLDFAVKKDDLSLRKERDMEDGEKKKVRSMSICGENDKDRVVIWVVFSKSQTNNASRRA
jgi:hypothetical protein